MPPPSQHRAVPDEEANLTTAVHRLADLIELLTTSIDRLVTELQWQNNERSQDYCQQHLPLTGLPHDPATRDWHPTFGDGQRSPIPADTGATTKPKSSCLFD